LNNYKELAGVRFLQRTDILNWHTNLPEGKCHIQDPDDPEHGLCMYSKAPYLAAVKSRTASLYLIPEDECPKTDEICSGCYSTFIKRKKELAMEVIPVIKCVNVNGCDYVKVKYAKTMIEAAEERGREQIRATIPLAEQVGTDTFGAPVYKINNEFYVKEVGRTIQKGEVRTLQIVDRRVALDQRKWGRKIFSTFLCIKTTDVEYKAGQKVRIIIEKERD
jgi:hypothetical protein